MCGAVACMTKAEKLADFVNTAEDTSKAKALDHHRKILECAVIPTPIQDVDFLQVNKA